VATTSMQGNRVKRRLFHVVAAASLVVCLADAALWVRSYWHATWFIVKHECLDEHGYRRTSRWIVSELGAVAFQSIQLEDDGRRPRSLEYVPPRGWSLTVNEDPPQHPTRRWLMEELGTLRQFGGFSVHHRQTPTSWAPATGYAWQTNFTQRDLVVPHWFVVSVSALAPAMWSWSRIHRGRSRERGRCPSCGYDLRSRARCPGCGTVPASAAESRMIRRCSGPARIQPGDSFADSAFGLISLRIDEEPHAGKSGT